MKTILSLVFLSCLFLLNTACDKCKHIACTPPPTEFNFQLIDKDSGEDLVANGTYNADEISVFSIAKNKKHELVLSTDSMAYFFKDQEIGWETGPENASYELRLNPVTVLPFYYESKESKDGCCTFFELVKFEIDEAEQAYIPAQNLFQLKL